VSFAAENVEQQALPMLLGTFLPKMDSAKRNHATSLNCSTVYKFYRELTTILVT
jgi:hypothetical protein